jgi:peptide/nickel transport system ATP-binding protein
VTSGALEVRGLSKEFPVGGAFRKSRLHAVDDVSFTLEPGHVTALAGESGSGKSTVARLLARLYEPTSGSVVFDGKDISHEHGTKGLLAYRSQVQMIFQDPFGSLNPVKTVRHHLERPLKIHGIAHGADVERRVLNLLETVGLVPPKHIADKYPHEISGGPRQRVSIARALAVEPRVVIADEPISMLDVSIRIGILNLIADLKDQHGLSFLYVTHDLASARYVADELLVMYAGHIVEQGPVDSVLGEPLHPYTELLISSVPDARLGERERIEIHRGGQTAAVDPGPGCRFVDRCPIAIDICSSVTPPLVVARPGHAARCHVTAPASSSHREEPHVQSIR